MNTNKPTASTVRAHVATLLAAKRTQPENAAKLEASIDAILATLMKGQVARAHALAVAAVSA